LIGDILSINIPLFEEIELNIIASETEVFRVGKNNLAVKTNSSN